MPTTAAAVDATITAPYVYDVTNRDRAIPTEWALLMAPYGVESVMWQLWPSPPNDPGMAPCLCIRMQGSDGFPYFANAPESPDGAWTLDMYCEYLGLVEQGKFENLANTLDQVRPQFVV